MKIIRHPYGKHVFPELPNKHAKAGIAYNLPHTYDWNSF